VPFFGLFLSLCRVHSRERPVWSCGVVDWFGRPPNEQPVAWSDSWSHTDQNTNNKWWTIHACTDEVCSVHTLHVCTFDAWTNSEYMCGAVMGSNTCVQLRTWVCPYRHHVSTRRWQFRLERIRRGWSKTMVRKNDCSGIEQLRRIENRLVRLRSEKSSKFWKLKTRLRTPQ